MELIEHPSPNFNDRKLPVSLLVLHYTGMKTGQAALERMCDREAGVSAHYMVEEDGRVFQLVAEDKRAWHAGVSSWRGITDVNSASIGIEIVNGGHEYGLPDFPDAQIGAVIALCQDILSHQTIRPWDIVGHSDIAPDRKQDPGEKFPWKTLAGQGIGLWPQDSTQTGAERLEGRELLNRLGYGAGYALKDCVTAFQRRFRPARVTGELDAETIGLMRSLLQQHP